MDRPQNPPHLRLLYTEDGEKRVSSPAVCEPGDDGYTFSFGFSYPRAGRRGACGYVCYSIEAASSVMTIVDSGINYRHQESLLQYPVRTALEGGRAFWLGQDALQFFSRGGDGRWFHKLKKPPPRHGGGGCCCSQYAVLALFPRYGLQLRAVSVAGIRLPTPTQSPSTPRFSSRGPCLGHLKSLPRAVLSSRTRGPWRAPH